MQLVAYEVLYRNEHNNFATITCGMEATLELLINYCCSVADDQTPEDILIFVNLTREHILSDCFFPLDKSRFVIEILEDTKVDELFSKKIHQLKLQGYKFALDDYSLDDRFDPILHLVNYIKVDILESADKNIPSILKLIKDTKFSDSNILPIFLAEKVETEEVLNQCLSEDYELFQGYFLARPKIVYGKRLSASKKTTLLLISELQSINCTTEVIFNLVKTNSKLCYMLLRIVNSPATPSTTEIKSVKEAIIYLGLEELKKWVMILSFSDSEETPVELIRILLERAKSCEILAPLAKVDSETAFTSGLFSGLDLVMKADKIWLLKNLTLPDEIIDAVIYFEGLLGQLLMTVMESEKGLLIHRDGLIQVDHSELEFAKSQATIWTNKILQSIL